jgi:protein-L-isoaspartate(D-aspartate) O-methyltransferase
MGMPPLRRKPPTRPRRSWGLALAALLAAAAPPAERAAERELMVLTVANMAEVAGAREARRLDPAVVEAMRRVPRHRFVPEEISGHAYRNSALPIGHDQTISQPYIVALMTHLLEVEPGHRILEVGTGSGYQAALLAELGARVFSIEIVVPLARDAAARLDELGYGGVEVRAGDGYEGWPEEAPYDRIVVTAAAPHLPRPLLAQLKPGGRMVIPLARPGGDELMLVEKDRRGRIRSRAILPVRFVPLIRPAGD